MEPTITEPSICDAKQKGRSVEPLFETGRVFIERRILDKFSLAAVDESLAYHVEGVTGPCSDWGHVREICLRDGGPIFSMFRDECGNEIRILTAPDRSSTTVTIAPVAR